MQRHGTALATPQVAERFEAKRARKFAAADALRDELRTTWGVSIDDPAREWRIMSDESRIRAARRR